MYGCGLSILVFKGIMPNHDYAGGGAPAPAPAPAPASGGGDIFDDLFGGGGGAAPAPAAPKLAFSKTAVNKATFQGHWKKAAVRYA